MVCWEAAASTLKHWPRNTQTNGTAHTPNCRVLWIVEQMRTDTAPALSLCCLVGRQLGQTMLDMCWTTHKKCILMPVPTHAKRHQR